MTWGRCCLQFWDLWGRLLHLFRPPESSGLEPALFSMPRSQKQWGRSCVWWTCRAPLAVPVQAFNSKSHVMLSVKMVFQSEFLPMKLCNVLGIVFSSALESVCVYSSMAAWYPWISCIWASFGPSCDSWARFCWTLLKKKGINYFYKTGGRLSVRTVFS